MKTCTRCKEEKPLTEFFRKKEGYQSRCKICKKAVDTTIKKRLWKRYLEIGRAEFVAERKAKKDAIIERKERLAMLKVALGR